MWPTPILVAPRNNQNCFLAYVKFAWYKICTRAAKKQKTKNKTKQNKTQTKTKKRQQKKKKQKTKNNKIQTTPPPKKKKKKKKYKTNPSNNKKTNKQTNKQQNSRLHHGNQHSCLRGNEQEGKVNHPSNCGDTLVS